MWVAVHLVDYEWTSRIPSSRQLYAVSVPWCLLRLPKLIYIRTKECLINGKRLLSGFFSRPHFTQSKTRLFDERKGIVFYWFNWFIIIYNNVGWFHSIRRKFIHVKRGQFELQADKTKIDFVLCPFQVIAFDRLNITPLDSGNFFCVRQMIVRSAGQRFQNTIENYATCTASSIYISFRIVVAPPIVSFAAFAVAIVHVIVYDQTRCCPWCFYKFQFIRYWVEKKKRKRKTHFS